MDMYYSNSILISKTPQAGAAVGLLLRAFGQSRCVDPHAAARPIFVVEVESLRSCDRKLLRLAWLRLVVFALLLFSLLYSVLVVIQW